MADPRAAEIDFILVQEPTEGLFHTAAVHNRSHIEVDISVEETMRVTRKTKSVCVVIISTDTHCVW